MGEFVRAAEVEEIPTGQSKLIEVGGKEIAVFNVDGAYYAIDNGCSHHGASLAGAPVNGTAVVCPWHGARFDIVTGEALSPPAARGVACYNVRVAGESVEVEV